MSQKIDIWINYLSYNWLNYQLTLPFSLHEYQHIVLAIPVFLTNLWNRKKLWNQIGNWEKIHEILTFKMTNTKSKDHGNHNDQGCSQIKVQGLVGLMKVGAAFDYFWKSVHEFCWRISRWANRIWNINEIINKLCIEKKDV